MRSSARFGLSGLDGLRRSFARVKVTKKKCDANGHLNEIGEVPRYSIWVRSPDKENIKQISSYGNLEGFSQAAREKP